MVDNQVVDKLSGWNAEATIPEMRAGDTVRVHVRIVEGGRERVQVFQGVVMRLRQGKGTFTVRRIAAHGIGVERTFPLASPRIERVEVVRRAKVRRAQLYFLRKYRGKAARLKEDRSGLTSGQ
ncbi:MAG: 50S ribosomal protein L19 [Anaerolineae bacterium]|jgi:large subunit ribosomal protein L19